MGGKAFTARGYTTWYGQNPVVILNDHYLKTDAKLRDRELPATLGTNSGSWSVVWPRAKQKVTRCLSPA